MPTSFFQAAKKGDKQILEHGINADNVDIKDGEKGYTLLCYAAAHNQKDAVDFLLMKHANINTQGGELNQSPLMLATERNHDAIVNRLLEESNIDVNLIDKHGRNALMLAVLSTNISAIHALISKTNLEQINSFGDTVFHLSDNPAVNDILVPYLQPQP